nr:MAG TPA: hypothetical protein [Caudoviricetes sp.]
MIYARDFPSNRNKGVIPLSSGTSPPLLMR